MFKTKMTSFRFSRYFKLKIQNFSYQIHHLFKLGLLMKNMEQFKSLTHLFQLKIVFSILVNLKLGLLFLI